MTSDPDRLLGSASMGDGAELEREVLRSIIDVSPPDGAKEAAWRGISGELAAASVVAAAAGAAAYGQAASPALPAAGAATTSLAPQAGASFAHALTVKVVAGVVVAAGAATAIGGSWLAHTPPAVVAPKSVEAPRVVAPIPPAVPEETTQVVESTEPAPYVVRPTAENARSAKPRLDEALALESQLVTQARADLKRGDPRAALATLSRLRRESPRGVLHQEREVLTIQALAAAGQKSAAKARAKAFVQAYPTSPHAPLLRPLASDP